MSTQNLELVAATKNAVHIAAVDRANKEPLPGPLAEAFKPILDIEVGPYKVRPLVHSDYTLFKELNSPFYRQMVSHDPNEQITPETEEIFEICYQFTRTPKECRATLAKGRQAFREASFEVFGDKPLNDDTTVKVFSAVVEQFKLAQSTLQTHAAPKEEGKEDVTFFPVTESQRTG